MDFVLNTLFWLNLSLLFIHEMDAVYRHEWRLFIFLNRLKDKTAYQIFTILHIPLLIVVFYFLSNPAEVNQDYFIIFIDTFLIIHLGLHYLLRNHKNNELNSIFSKSIIQMMAVSGFCHLTLFIFINR